MAWRNPPTLQGPGLNPNPNLCGMMQDLGYRGSAIMTGVFDVKGSGQKVTKILPPPPRCWNALDTEQASWTCNVLPECSDHGRLDYVRSGRTKRASFVCSDGYMGGTRVGQ